VTGIQNEIAFVRYHDGRDRQYRRPGLAKPSLSDRGKAWRCGKRPPVSRHVDDCHRINCDIRAEIDGDGDQIHRFEVGIDVDEAFERGER
jgi:hypothetical protein